MHVTRQLLIIPGKTLRRGGLREQHLHRQHRQHRRRGQRSRFGSQSLQHGVTRTLRMQASCADVRRARCRLRCQCPWMRQLQVRGASPMVRGARQTFIPCASATTIARAWLPSSRSVRVLGPWSCCRRIEANWRSTHAIFKRASDITQLRSKRTQLITYTIPIGQHVMPCCRTMRQLAGTRRDVCS